MFMRLDIRALLKGIIGGLILVGFILLGSRRLLYFDAALSPYLYATIFAVFAIIYRYNVWVSRPPTAVLWKRSLQFIFSRKFFKYFILVFKTFIEQIILQRFIGRRSPYRWITHFTIAWGCLIAFAVTFPLVFGWLHFENPPGHGNLYQLVVFGFPAQIFNPDGIIGFFFFNALNFCSVLIIIGTVMAFTRRFFDPGEISTQTFAYDLLPLLILFSVAATGLFLTFSNHFLGGANYRVLTTIHCWTVVMLLIYLPFGKFFHIFQRAAQMGAALYIEEKEHGEPALCIRCHTPFTSAMQKEDVKRVLRDLGFEFQADDNKPSMQDLCPMCRRHMLMLTQHNKLKGKFDVAQM
ncbi:MAG: MFS transporter [Candidatus Omnitrophica bacterium]|nr:MFS transporter [Candidatus Omnitrophota bacterium]